MLDSASSTAKRHINHADRCAVVDIKCLFDSSPSRDSLYHCLVAYVFSTVWTQCNERYDLLVRRINKTSLELFLCCLECVLQLWDKWNIDCNRHTL
jgi:hypothetical protein